MDFEKLAKQAEHIVQERGGMESVKEDAQQLAGIAKGDGSAADKLKEAAQAVKEPGAPSHKD